MVLQILSGPLKGEKRPLAVSMIIGRSQGDIVLKDPQVDDPHAEINWKENQYIVKDLNSKNGIIFEKKKVSFLVLKNGTEFQIGSSRIKVEDTVQKKKTIIEKNSSKKSSIDTLFLENKLYDLKDESQVLNVLSQPVQLVFEKGTQKNTIWNIQYLPRTIGSPNADLPLVDPKVEDIDFKLLWQKNQVFFFTHYKDQILLNYKNQKSAPLKNKDLIIAGSAYIRVCI